MSDDEANKLLAAMDAPDTSAEESSELSDDEAQRLLAEMDSPTTPSNDAGEINDDEAQRLLAEMDSPSIASPSSEAAESVKFEIETQNESSTSQTPEDFSGPEWIDNEFSSDPEMLKEFMQNCADLMETLDEAVLKLEQEPDDKDTIEEIFRAAHTLKGAAGMFGFVAIEKVMHRMENLFDLVRKEKSSPTPDTIDVVLQGLDILKSLIEAVVNSTPSGQNIGPIIVALKRASEGKVGFTEDIKKEQQRSSANSQASEAPAIDNKEAPPQVPATPAAKSQGDGAQKEAPKKTEQSTIRVDLDRLDSLVNLVGELVIDRTRFITIEEGVRTSNPSSKVSSHLTETVQLFGRHLNEVQDIIVKLRMVPIGNAFNKFPRVVRDLSRSLGKDINLMIEGESTELDKTLVEQIGDPLVHLVRNSCDHKIESPEQREKSGKKAKGKILLSAHQEGNHIIIKIRDDGKGMDPQIIKRKGIEKGLIKEDTNLSDSDIFNLIFEPGFSTAEKVTTVSGRGVGMDVVKKQISKLKGMIDISSEPGKGTTITIQLPLTLAIVQSLLIESKHEVYAIPLSSVVESIRIKPTEIQKVGDAEVIKLRDHVLPLLHLDDMLTLSAKKSHVWYSTNQSTKFTVRKKDRSKERLYVVVVGSSERKFGIIVDSLLNQQEMVIKSMGPVMKRVPCFAGGAVLGNGEVVLVLDIAELENSFKTKMRNTQLAS